MTELRGAKVLLTGASRGLGRALAQALGREGAHLALVARDAGGLEVVAREVEAAGGSAVVIPADLADADAAVALGPRAEEALGGVDVVIHNAGIEPFVDFEALDVATIDASLAVNLRAPLVITRALVPGMLARGRGHVVFLGSTSGLLYAPHAAVYGATKAALASVAWSLAVELRGRGVASTVVQPGFVVGTGMFEDRRGDLVPPALTGSTTTDAVVRAVLDALRHERTSVIVNSAPMGLATALGRLMPRLAVALGERAVRPFMERLARQGPQGSKR